MTNIDARAIHQAVCAIDGCDSPLPSDQQRAEHLTPLIAAAVDAARAEGVSEGLRLAAQLVWDNDITGSEAIVEFLVQRADALTKATP